MIKTIGVVGAGTMGSGIAQVFASYGFNVILNDISLELLQTAKGNIRRSLEKLESKGKLNNALSDILLKIKITDNLVELAESDFIIEVATEKMELKKDLIKNIDSIASANTIIATNTSALSITELAACTNNPDKFVGMHFFNPAPLMKLVEVVKGLTTSDETINLIFDLAKKLDKSPILINEAPGFVVNRILIPMINEAIEILKDGVATKEDIDKAMKLGAGHPMGPLQLADLIGLDVVLAIMETLYSETGDPKYRPSILLKKYVRANLLGRKTKRGFYEYN
jgi:3-hydroxybutyryl-CoA dehydrogenase